MAGLTFVAGDTVSTVGSGSPTLLLLATSGADVGIVIKEVSVSFQGIVTTEAPYEVELLRCTDAGTGGSSLTPRAMNQAVVEGTISSQTTATKGTFSAEPAASDVIKNWHVHPQTGLTYPFPPNQELVCIETGGAAYIAVRLVVPTVSVDCEVYMVWEE